MTTTVQSRPIAPRVNVYEDAESFIIQAEMPGVDREHTHIEVNDGALTLRGTRTVANGSSTVHVRERARGEFHRRFSLGKGVDLQSVQARMNDGLLTITLPKTKRLQPQVISID
jgi:HSP20 family protein